jgi:hypothetical protein
MFVLVILHKGKGNRRVFNVVDEKNRVVFTSNNQEESKAEQKRLNDLSKVAA